MLSREPRMIPGIDPMSSMPSKPKFDIPEAPVAQARDQCQRNRVRDVGAYEFRRRQTVRVQVHEHHDAERPGADGRERDQKPEQRAGDHGQARLCPLEPRRRRRPQFLAEAMKRGLEQHGDTGQGERDAQARQQQHSNPLFLGEVVQQRERKRGGREAARSEAPQHQPVDRSPGTVHPATETLGDRRKKQIGADRRLGCDPEQEDEQRGHQRPAADAGEPDQDTDTKSCNGIEKIHRCAF